jgi:PBSX family phage terminase large subunit
MYRLGATELNISLYGKQHDFVTSAERFTAFIGGIGSGKTHAGAVKALMQCQRAGALGMVIAPTYPMLRDATLRVFLRVAGKCLASFNKSEMRAVMRNSSEVLFRSADDPERLRGPSVHWGWIDEAALCARETFDIVIGRARADGTAGPVWITGTPKGRNWVYDRAQDGTLRVFRARTEDNPYLAADFIRGLRAAYSGAFAKQELDAEFVAFEGLVYDEFSRDVHVRERDRAEFQRFIIGVDEGYTNPAVALVIGLDADGRAHVVEEFYQRRVLQETFVDVARRLANQYSASAIYVDPSATGLIAEMASAGLPVYAANHDVTDGIQTVKSYLATQGDGRPRLTVSPGCVNALSEFESYVWQKDRKGDATDKPEKQNDHAMDALRYALHTLRPRAEEGVMFYDDRVIVSPY